jgi:Bacteriophage tail assembly protein
MAETAASISPRLQANVQHVAENLLAGLRPPPEMTISQWAEKYRVLAGSASSEPGRWSNERTPYLVEIMDELSPQSSATDVVFMKGSQIGGTEVLINTALYYIKHCPSPIGAFQTTEQTAKRFLKQRMNPAFAAMGMENIFYGDEMYLKEFPGGVLVTGWSNSPSHFRSAPFRVFLGDEISEWPKDCGGQGDPCELGRRRTTNFPRRKLFWNSTPGIDGECRITEMFFGGDQRHYQVPCPHCGELHKWEWANVVWDCDADGHNLPETVRMKCPHCDAEYGEHYKTELMAQGQWVKENPDGDYPSFHINALYSPLGWYSWKNAVWDFLKAKGDVNKMKSFTNNVLGEAWSLDGGKVIDPNGLMTRCEEYEAEVPDGAVVLTAGVDVQDDRLEVEIVGWGRGLENWGITNRVLVGNPSESFVWEALDSVLMAGYGNSMNEKLYVAAALIDSGGHHTADVYRYTSKRERRNIFACVGKAGLARPLVTRPKKTDKSSVYDANIVNVGVDIAKDQFYDWIAIERPGPGYCHFPAKPDEYNSEFFAQLTAEKRFKKWVRGAQVWAYKKLRPRNEALDKRNYARGALNITGIDVDKFADAGKKFLRNLNAPVHRKRGLMISGGVNI